MRGTEYIRARHPSSPLIFETLTIPDPHTLISSNIATALTMSENRADYDYEDDYEDNEEAQAQDQAADAAAQAAQAQAQAQADYAYSISRAQRLRE